MFNDLVSIIQTASNPFRKSNVKSAWEEDIYDVESINKKCFKEILEEITEISSGEYDSFIHLMLGEVGLGKTHLLARLRKKTQDFNFYFVEIEPVPNIDKFFIHILRELSWNLRKKIPNSEFTFLEQLVANLLFKQMEKALKGNKRFKNLLTKLKKSPTKIFKLNLSQEDFDTIKQIMIPKISKDYPGIEIQLVQILFEAIDPRKFLYAIKWLQCESLSEEEMEVIGAAISIAEENLAFNILKSLLILSDKIVVFAFDQIESVEKSFGILGLKKFFQQIVQIYNTCKNHLSLVMVQTGVWDTYVRDNLDQSVIDRIENFSKLEKLTLEQSEEIITKRLEIIWKRAKKTPSDPVFPFTKKNVEEISTKSAWNPRQLIKNAGIHFKNLQTSFDKELTPKIDLTEEEIEKDEEEFLKDILIEFEEKYHVEYLNSSIDKRQDVIISVLYQIWKAMKEKHIKLFDFDVINCEINKIFERGKKGINLYLQIQHKEHLKKIGIECNNDKNMLRLYHSLNRLKSFQEADYFQMSILLREKDMPVKRSATKTIELLDWIQNNGARFEVIPETNIQLYAIKKLLDSASAGELTYNDKIISYEELIRGLINSIIDSIDIFVYLQDFLNKNFEITKNFNKNTKQLNHLGQFEEEIWGFIKKRKIIGLKTVSDNFPHVNKDQLLYHLRSLEKEKQISIENGPNDELLIFYEFPKDTS